MYAFVAALHRFHWARVGPFADDLFRRQLFFLYDAVLVEIVGFVGIGYYAGAGAGAELPPPKLASYEV
jgi:hypothetical protein